MFAEYCEVHGNFYGTHQGKLNEIINKGKVHIVLYRYAYSILTYKEDKKYTRKCPNAISYSSTHQISKH